MRLPAVALTAAFVCGIAVGLLPKVSVHASSPGLVAGLFVLAALATVAGAVLAFRNQLWPAAVAAVFCWMMLGLAGATLGQQPRPADHIVSRIENGGLDLHSPLRWHGILRDEPQRLPWGYGYDVELRGVDYQGQFVPLQGGLRLSFSPPISKNAAAPRNSKESAPAGTQPLDGVSAMEGEAPSQVPDVHAGDEITVLTEARRPQVFRDEGAFDRRAFLASQNIDLVGTLRAAQLLQRVTPALPSVGVFIARTRRRMRDEIDTLFAARPDVAGVLRAMLLGDRTFVDRTESQNFQRTGVFHVLVVAGLHVAAIAAALFWLGRKLRFPTSVTTLLMLATLLCYTALVEQRASVLRAALMVAILALGRLWFRRLDMLNSAAIAALILLVAKPLLVLDPSFQLTFVAVGCVAGLAGPWIDRFTEPYLYALRELQNIPRDASYAPKVAQFRIDLRSFLNWLRRQIPAWTHRPAQVLTIASLRVLLAIIAMMLITVVLQIGMLPMMTRDFHRVTLSGPFANLATVPLLGVMVPLGLLALLSGLVVPALGKLLAIPLAWIATLLLQIVAFFAGLIHWNYPIPGPPLSLAIFFFVAGITLATALRLQFRWRAQLAIAASVTLLVAAGIIATFPFPAQWHRGQMELTVLDVGQGDSLFLVSPAGRTLLIDGGGAFAGFPGRPEHTGIDPGEEAVSPYLWSRGYKHLDVVAVTHGHQDHLGGLTAVLENFHVGTLFVGREIPNSALARLEDLARTRGTQIVHESRGEQIHWDGAEAQILWPESPDAVSTPAKLDSAKLDPARPASEAAAPANNNDSIVMRWAYGSRTFLLPGDAEKQVERQILSENPAALHADVLKVGHHGSKNSTTDDFLAAVHPQVAIISAGENNPYGHPSPELLARLQNANIRILRTDRDGAVHILTDGQHLEISCFIPCPETPSPTNANATNANASNALSTNAAAAGAVGKSSAPANSSAQPQPPNQNQRPQHQ
jgi:competence protein ComEC